MNLSKFTALTVMIASSQASPITTFASIQKRDPCDGVNALPILYHEYREEQCPAKNKLDADGSCTSVQHFDSPFWNMECSAFCQTSTQFVFATEIPFENSYCHGPFTCTITDTQTVTIAKGGTVNLKFLEAYGLGVSGTYTQSDATAFARAYQIKLNEGQCGYFTFVPVRRDVCGIATSTTYRSSFAGGEVHSYCGTDYTNEPLCASDQRLRSDGTPDGETIFVYTDCGNRAPKPLPEQDPIYQKPGVPLSREALDTMISTWESVKKEVEPLPEAKNECHGISGDVWVMDRDLAANNVIDFCQNSEQVLEYNRGSVNHLRLSVIPPPQDSTKGPLDAPDCVGRFTKTVIDGCDGNELVNNPHNYKFGGTFTASDGWVYKFEPLSKQVNEASCDVTYKFAFDGFEIRGKNFPDAPFGANGEGLKKQLTGCGALTNWHFERTPKNVKFQWFASGQLPLGTKPCIGRALRTAGSSSKGNCH